MFPGTTIDYSKGISSNDLNVILSDSYWLGSLSPLLETIPMIDVIEKYADYITSVNGSITVEALVQNFRMKPTDASLLISWVFAGAEDMANSITTIAYDIRPYLPHPTNPYLILPLYITLTVFTTLVMILRLWSRHRVAGGLRSFDMLAFIGFLMATLWGALAVYQSNIIGHYTASYDRTFASIKQSSAVYLALVIMYPWTTMVIKFSLLLFYYRISKMIYIQKYAYAIAIIIAATTVISTILYANGYPHVDYWNHPFDSIRVNQRDAQTAITCIFIITDAIISVFPIPIVFQLKLYPREKFLAIYTFSMVGIVCIAGGFRLQAIREAYTYDSKDKNAFLINAWTIVELNLALICGSAPAVRALVIHYAPKILRSASSP